MHRIVLFMAYYWYMYLFMIHLDVAFSIPETHIQQITVEVRQVSNKFHILMPFM